MSSLLGVIGLEHLFCLVGVTGVEQFLNRYLQLSDF
jgi:hypothetical protein